MKDQICNFFSKKHAILKKDMDPEQLFNPDVFSKDVDLGSINKNGESTRLVTIRYLFIL